jgi:predicted nucleic acid-binding Zn ribbon protein
MSEHHNTKKCRFCGKELPEEAIFCYYCQRELLTRPERPGSEAPSKPFNNIILVVVILIVISLVMFFIFN